MSITSNEIDQKRKKTSLLITGANGFVGRSILNELLSPINSLIPYESYSTIYAIDICRGEIISQYVEYSCRIIPIQMNLMEILDSTSLSYKALQSLLQNEVKSIIHTAAIVDTRECSPVQSKLMIINVKVTEALVALAKDCGVSRFVHLSSASATAKKSSQYRCPWYFAFFFPNSLLTNCELSTYGKTKRLGEEAVLRIGSSPASSASLSSSSSSLMKTVVLRPHVVWGNGDPLATDIMLQWNYSLWGPQPIIGDPENMVVSVHVKTLARLILLADVGLADVSLHGNSINGRILNVGEEYHSLAALHRFILSTKGKGRYATMKEIVPIQANKRYLIALPHWISSLLIFTVQTIDWLTGYRQSQSIFRLLTSGNFGYTLNGFLQNEEYIKTFSEHSSVLFESASKPIQKPLIHSSTADPWWNVMDSAKIRSPLSDLSILSSSRKTFMALPPSEQYSFVSNHLISQEWNLGPIILRNRVIKAATFECMGEEADGVPTEQLINYHKANASGGVGLTIVAYASVSYDGRSFPSQICLAKDQSSSQLLKVYDRTVQMLQKLTKAVHKQGGKACIQITHAGAFNDPHTNLRSTLEPPRGPSSILNPLTFRWSKSLDGDEKELQRIENDFAKAVVTCQNANFDAIEVHLGHGYLLSQFLSRRTNPLHANDPDARLAFPLRVLKKVIAIAHGGDLIPFSNVLPAQSFKKMAVIVKFNISELTEEDLPLSDCRLFARAFIDAGADLIVPSGGQVMVNGLHMLRGNVPVNEMAAAQTNSFKSWIVKLLGPWLIPTEQYREAFFLERTLSVCLGAGIPLNKVCLIGGIHDVVTVLRATGENRYGEDGNEDPYGGYGFAAVQMGRILLADTNFCLKVGIAGSGADSHATKEQKDQTRFARKLANCCDNSNSCIIGATMALQPLQCTKYPSSDW